MSGLLNLRRQDNDEIPFAVRFRAWWDGVDPQALLRKGGQANAIEAPFIHLDEDEDEPDDGRNWPAQRLAICQRLWGEGCSQPGGIEYMLQLVTPFGVDPSMSILDLATGLGGGTRAIAKEFDVWITGLEPDAELSSAAHAYSVQKGLEKRVPISHVDPTKLQLPTGKFDCVLMRNSLNIYDDKVEALQMVKNSLKSEGQFIMTDFVLADENSRTDDFKQWQELTTLRPKPWTIMECKAAVNDLDFMVHIFEDETDAYRQIIVAGWEKFVSRLKKEEMSRNIINVLIREAEIWLYLVRALESGNLRYMRMHVTKPKILSMSDA